MSFKVYFLFFFIALEASAKVQVVATTIDVAWLVYQIGGDNVDVKTLAKAKDSYHFVDARPDFILAANKADILCRIGVDLEIGWLPKVIEKAANKKIMSNAAGDCDLSRSVNIQDKPEGRVDRSKGDVHSSGNPHFWFSPLRMIEASSEVEKRLALVMPEKAREFEENRKVTQENLKKIFEEMKNILQPLTNKKVIEYHKDFFYFLNDFKIETVGSIEEIPGVSPSVARLASVSLVAKKEEVKIALATNHSPKNILEKFKELSGVGFVAVQTSLDNPENKDSYEKWLKSIASDLLIELK